ncbi:hypothetical protein BP6252_06565 [Coleophoma cylindrospora]|uniref:Wax synthase domain-containing protein n=1 Tax=Coleophoma cylindrospora TaxID=1849047 RepID=A0A3D8RN01_9HELO|nr:hypothetical protein BP6252_06565 [Coleophoma cylindrospora]
MDFFLLFQPLLIFLFATLLFYLAVQVPKGCYRLVCGSLHVIFAAVSIQFHPDIIALYPGITVPFVIGFTVHTTSILLTGWHVLDSDSNSSLHRFKEISRTWSNIRHLELGHDAACNSMPRERLLFAIRRGVVALFSWIINYVISIIFPQILLKIGVRIQDFAPDKQGILLHLTWHDLFLRALISLHWIWTTYYALNCWHIIYAIAFVAIFRRDRPSEWPPLFGSLFEAFTLRRFWGIFWHRLHIAPFKDLTPAFLQKFPVLRAFWIFLLSAACHTLSNWIIYHTNTAKEDFWFFSTAYAICLVETLSSKAFLATMREIDSGYLMINRVGPFLGYAWVLTFFVYAIGRWQYPLVYKSLGG